MSNKKNSSSGCGFSSIFRLFLCSRSPQTHPSDHIAELKHVDDAAKVQVQASETGPGIVARLMGLDSLPKAPGPVTRSRSVNFVDHMLDFDSTHAGHRRVKTSTSFREVLLVPQGLLQQNQNHELLVACMDKIKKMEFESSGKQKENVKKEHQEKNKKISKLKNEPRRVSRAKTPVKEASVESSKKKKKQCEVKKAEYSENSSEGSSSSSSPVSVLNVNDSKTLKPKLEKNSESKHKEETLYYMELLDKPCKLTEKDINFSNWTTKKVFMFEDFEDICMEFEEQILDLMLHQVADELVGFHICTLIPK